MQQLRVERQGAEDGMGWEEEGDGGGEEGAGRVCVSMKDKEVLEMVDERSRYASSYLPRLLLCNVRYSHVAYGAICLGACCAKSDTHLKRMGLFAYALAV
eukprot:2070789-Rhodomonas_salina.1